jgi:hypothetical protein
MTLGARLRAVRMQRYLSLRGVERNSGGRWKAVAVASIGAAPELLRDRTVRR